MLFRSWYDSPALKRLRLLNRFVKFFLGNYFALGYSYFAAIVLYYPFVLIKYSIIFRFISSFLEKYLFPVPHIRDYRWRILDMYDAISPVYASTHSAEEVENWYSHNHCYDVIQTSWCETSYVGTKNK